MRRTASRTTYSTSVPSAPSPFCGGASTIIRSPRTSRTASDPRSSFRKADAGDLTRDSTWSSASNAAADGVLSLKASLLRRAIHASFSRGGLVFRGGPRRRSSSAMSSSTSAVAALSGCGAGGLRACSRRDATWSATLRLASAANAAAAFFSCDESRGASANRKSDAASSPRLSFAVATSCCRARSASLASAAYVAGKSRAEARSSISETRDLNACGEKSSFTACAFALPRRPPPNVRCTTAVDRKSSPRGTWTWSA
mmetsp:Transcript_13129/g.43835  ORF Transcript_13129/g.43835 Transcript_13129/m.43835 type:complete len:257 (-) Transcript_13129:573-1343(-)